jgi:DNA-binding NtrC family response regulator
VSVTQAREEVDPGGGIPILEQVTKAQRQAEADAILTALNATRWNRKQASALLKIDYKALLYKMKKLGMDDKPPGTSEDPPAILTVGSSS